MRAVVCEKFGPPSSLRESEITTPDIGPEEALIEVHAAGVGFVDGLMIQGKYQVKPSLPYYPGSEFSGVVVKTGADVGDLSVGSRVMGLAGSGAFSQFVALPASRLITLPDEINHTTAASLYINYATALYGLRDCGKLEKGETLLILGASGGVGSAAITIAKAMGAHVIGAASSKEKRSATIRFGADASIDYTKEEWRSELKALTPGGLNVVYDPVGGDYAETAFRALAPGGRFLVVGFAAGTIPSIPLNLALLKRSSIVGVDWGGESRAHPEINHVLITTILSWIESGGLQPAEVVTRPIREVREALEDQLAGRIVGKLVLINE